ncbi:uncharacterized protein LOC111083395 [Limulus polyphemus]|uniref:Uncharacterized protein LOC111083395 n=1 Tax=Limulus polyphemus TaxID=6850 RepID=A0ABM1RW55_LIMPO|nr:uncharacterized protein LOC111083395 [Limulus polyphemus]
MIVAFSRKFCLDGSGSRDFGNHQGSLSYRWSCSIDGQIGCYESGSGGSRLEDVLKNEVFSPVMCVPGGLLPPARYTFTLLVFKGGRQDMVSVMVSIFPDDKIRTPVTKGKFRKEINPLELQKIRLETSDLTSFLYIILVKRLKSCYTYIPSYFLKTDDIIEVSLWLPPRCLVPDSLYVYGFITFTNVHTEITTRKVPRPGLLHVTPTSGVALFTKFTLDATRGWAAEESLYPLSYYFSYAFPESPDISWPLGAISHDIPALNDVRLPCGSSCRAMALLGSFIKSLWVTNSFSVAFETELGKLVDVVVIGAAQRFRQTQPYSTDEVDDQGAPVPSSMIKMVEMVLSIEKLHFEVNRKSTEREKTNGHLRRMEVLLTTTCKRRSQIPMTVTLPYMDIGIVSVNLVSRYYIYDINSKPIEQLRLPVHPLLTLEDTRCWQQCVSYIKYSINFVRKHMQWLMPLDKILLSPVVFSNIKSCSLNSEQRLASTRLKFPLTPEQSRNYTRCYSWIEHAVNLKPCETKFVQETIICVCDTLANSYMGLFEDDEHLNNGNVQSITDISGVVATEVTCVIHPAIDFGSEVHEMFEASLRHQIARALEINVTRILGLDLLPSMITFLNDLKHVYISD